MGTDDVTRTRHENIILRASARESTGSGSARRRSAAALQRRAKKGTVTKRRMAGPGGRRAVRAWALVVLLAAASARRVRPAVALTRDAVLAQRTRPRALLSGVSRSCPRPPSMRAAYWCPARRPSATEAGRCAAPRGRDAYVSSQTRSSVSCVEAQPLGAANPRCSADTAAAARHTPHPPQRPGRRRPGGRHPWRPDARLRHRPGLDVLGGRP